MSRDDEEAKRRFFDDLDKQRAIAADRSALWGADRNVSMVRLCQSFPTLRGAPGTDPWDPMALLRWILGGAATSGNTHAVKFVLQVWNSRVDWQQIARAPADSEHEGLGIKDAVLSPFNVVDALAVWDDEHTQAFLKWAHTPFWA